MTPTQMLLGMPVCTMAPNLDYNIQKQQSTRHLYNE